MVNKM